MNFKNYYNTLSSHQDEINQINHLYLNITSKGLIMDEMPHVEPYKKFDRSLFVPAKLKFTKYKYQCNSDNTIHHFSSILYKLIFSFF